MRMLLLTGLMNQKRIFFLLRKEEGWLSSYSSLITLPNKRSLKLLIEFLETISSFYVRFKNENVYNPKVKRHIYFIFFPVILHAFYTRAHIYFQEINYFNINSRVLLTLSSQFSFFFLRLIYSNCYSLSYTSSLFKECRFIGCQGFVIFMNDGGWLMRKLIDSNYLVGIKFKEVLMIYGGFLLRYRKVSQMA